MTTAERELLLDLSQPDEAVIELLAAGIGDLLLLGAGGKIGHPLALMARRALKVFGSKRRVIAVSRYSSPGVRDQLEKDGIVTIQCDLSDPEAVAELPDAHDVIFMSGQKFGTSGGGQPTTWVANVYVPAVVARRFRDSRLVTYSSGNVYPFADAASVGPAEDAPLGPVGEYAQSVVGRERIFEYFSRSYGTRVTTLRLNYANEPRYGVLVDIATRVMAGQPVDLAQGYVNVVWASDANRVTLRGLEIASSPPKILNLAGPKVAVRELAERFAASCGVEAKFRGVESDSCLISDGTVCWTTLGPPRTSLEEMVRRVAEWLKAGHSTWNKPTHFEVCDGKF